MRRKDYLPFGKPAFSGKEIAAVSRVLRRGWVGMGPETLAFEKELASHVGAPHLVTVNSCTAALSLSILVSEVGPGDEVICPSLTWCSTANAALYSGAKPVFCDVDPQTMSITPEHVLAKLTPRTKAVLAVHYGGRAVDVKKLKAALPKRVAVIEDAAHALGARFPGGRPVGASGNLTCYSFYANKNLSTGEGGAIALFDRRMAERLRSLRQHGLPSNAWNRFSHPRSLLAGDLVELGYKMNYTDLQACIGRVQLARQREFSDSRLAIARRYHNRLGGLIPGVGFQADSLHPGHARHLFVILLPIENLSCTRDEFILELRRRNVGASIHYAPLHHMPLYSRRAPPRLPNTEWLSRRILTLPISASMSLRDADCVIEEVRGLLRRRSLGARGKKPAHGKAR
jgi:dTDP-4-amino-4,6-dideoxygalactose transaminase